MNNTPPSNMTMAEVQEWYNKAIGQIDGKSLQIDPCTKCGYTKARLEHIPPEIEETYGGCKTVIQENDYLQVTCNRCGYQWRVDPLDKEEA